MINNNKILTVSYGTFSCTLEGFDDSFGTMKAIAEYFRDLSADDRYFGAEPAQPDAQMLARIAEREISRHVEAREDKGRIVLSAQSAQNSAAALVASDAVEDVADAIADATVAKAAADQIDADADDAAQAPTYEVDETPALPVEEAPEAKAPAPKLVAPKAKIINRKPATQAPAPKAEAEPAPRPVEQEAPSVEQGAENTPRVIVPSLPDEDVEAFFAERTTTTFDNEAAQDDEQEDVAPAQERAKADSIADKLKRIRAVVSQQGEAVAAPDYSEDQHADPSVAPAAKITDAVADDVEEEDAPSEAMLANTLRDLEDALDADDETEAAYEDDEDFDEDAESEDDDIAAILNRLERESDVEDHDEFDDEDEDTLTDDYDDDDDDDDMDDNILAAMDTVEAAVEDIDLVDDNLFDEASDAPEEAEAEIEAPAPVAPQPVRVAPRTRVLKVKRATLEAAIQSGQLEEYDEEEDEAPAQSLRKAPRTQRSSLSDEAEEALARELAELEADMEASDDDDFEDAYDDDAYEEEIAAAPVEEAPALRTRIRASADEDFSRLMEESEQQMEEPEAATRRDAFAHLRAAVAAKKADEAVGGTDADQETDEAYRDDLASVVRPRRPASGDRARTERPAEARPAPLKLVAEQRIDTAEPKSVMPVRPRRVAAMVQQDETAHAPHADGFADFADEMGAIKLPDLLEAAAAYLSFVEGHAQFSRPQLMTKVRQVEKDNFTREDGLRSFGKLLREGKIKKMKGGSFQASDQIGFKPAKRAAG